VLLLCCGNSGQLKKELRCQRHGIGKIAYTHHKDYILTSSSTVEGDHYLRYWCVYDNQYMRMFKAHNDQVTSLAMSPADDSFLSTSADGVLCLWNLSSPSCLAAMRLASSDYERPIAAYDPSGLVRVWVDLLCLLRLSHDASS
jgi:COMPASS component SWD2